MRINLAFAVDEPRLVRFAEPRMDSRLIFVVDDDDGIRGALHDVLESEGYRVESAVNGRAALKALAALPELPQLILLDLTMPVMNGWEFCAIRRLEPRLSSVPVLVFTAGGAAVPRADELGAQAVLRKPVDLDSLLRAVEHYALDAPGTLPAARTG